MDDEIIYATNNDLLHTLEVWVLVTYIPIVDLNFKLLELKEDFDV